MYFHKKLLKTLSYLSVTIFLVMSHVLFPPVAFGDFLLLEKGIIAYNSEKHNRSLSDGSYRGEEGILRMRPEVARSFGLSVPEDPYYLKAKELFTKADKYRERALDAISSLESEEFEGQHEELAGDMALISNEALRLAQRYMKAYRSRLDTKLDGRLNKDGCSKLTEKLLGECLQDTSHNLRDALGLFYNRSQGLSEKATPLTPENVEFVNYVFSDFITKASPEVLRGFDLDQHGRKKGANPASGLEDIVEGSGARYTLLVESAVEKHKKAPYCVDPFLFLALIKRESNFSPNAVSYVGAAGLTQIMPKTAKALGMKNIFEPPYFGEAVSLLARERKLRQKAIALIPRITEENRLKFAGLARKYMLKAIDCGKECAQLFSRYKRELLDKGSDDRLDPSKAIEHGYRYFSEMMQIQKGDISLALASYNAGPHRVKQYNGIPPYLETVAFRNSVLGHYKEYLKRLMDREKAREGEGRSADDSKR
jgi:soluble lytic murein transglycosylase-like protein